VGEPCGLRRDLAEGNLLWDLPEGKLLRELPKGNLLWNLPEGKLLRELPVGNLPGERVTDAITRRLAQRIDPERDAGEPCTRMRKTVDRQTNLVERVDALIDTIVEKLQPANINSCRLHQ
jgi:hypothetical protein